MPDFTVIDGGGKGQPPDDYARRLATDALRTLMIEILRSIARGEDRQGRVLKSLANFYDRIGETSDHFAIINDVVREMRANIAPEETELRYRLGVPEILVAALQLTAEKSSDDEFAKSRASKREETLRHAIEGFICGLEDQSRKHGGSYLKDFIKTHFGKRKPSGWDNFR
jgi:hypothetical protein